MSGSLEKATWTCELVLSRIVALSIRLTPEKSSAKRTAERKT